MEENEMEKAISDVLGSIGAYHQADRVFIFELQEGSGFWDNTYEWCRKGLISDKEEFRNIPSRILRRWIETFERDSSMFIEGLEEVCSEFPEECSLLKRKGARSLLLTPIRRNRLLIGLIGVVNPRTCIRDDAQIHTMSFFLADRLARNETEERLNELLDCRYEDILKVTGLGLWVIRLDPATGRGEMYADRTMRRIMDVKEGVTPQECYDHWYGRINDGYYHYVNLVVENMIQSRHAIQLEYTWNHPTKGEVVVRCLGVRVEDSDGMICLEGYHRIISEMDKPKFIRDAVASEMFEYNEKRKSIYFHTGRELLAGDAVRQENFPECWIQEEMVHSYFAEEFCYLFQNVREKEEIHGEEILLKTKSGAYEWFKIRTSHLGKEQQDMDTIVVMLYPAGQERTLELEYMRKSDFYQAMLSETVAYAEVDVDNDELKATGGLWDSYIEESRQWGETFTQVMERHIRQVVLPEEEELCHRFLDADEMRSMYKEEQHTRKCCFRRRIDGEYHWVELVVHVFQERFTEKTHALLYLKDIDVEKRRALMQEQEANHDPLTNVYNRRTFEREVKKHMEASMARGKEIGGALILLDMDNFKQINDLHGHLEGDMALKYLTQVLRSTFQCVDLVGRLGGDEFLVFIKDVDSQKVLDKRMKELFEALSIPRKIPISCSAGITLVKKEGFSYEESLKKADEALYKSKQRGKNTYSYYEE